MTWRYGIVKFRNPKNQDHRFYGIGELYYDKDPLNPHFCSADPIEPYSEPDEDSTEESVKEDIRSTLEMMLKDCAKYPIFDIDGPYAKSPWSEKRSLESLSYDQLNLMIDEDIKAWLESDES
jgi:hypothetical protein